VAVAVAVAALLSCAQATRQTSGFLQAARRAAALLARFLRLLAALGRLRWQSQSIKRSAAVRRSQVTIAQAGTSPACQMATS